MRDVTIVLVLVLVLLLMTPFELLLDLLSIVLGLESDESFRMAAGLIGMLEGKTLKSMASNASLSSSFPSFKSNNNALKRVFCS